MKKFKPLKPEHKVIREKEKYASSEEKALSKNVALAYAEEKLEDDFYKKIYKSYNVLKWTQLGILISGVVLTILIYIFLPDVIIDGKSLRGYMAALFILFYVVIILPVGMIGSSYTIGRLWTKYIKWFRTTGSTIPQLYEMLGMQYTDAAVRAAKRVNNKNKNVFKP